MILILSEDAAELAKMLDDAQLDKQIKTTAQVLCDVHYETLFKKYDGNLKALNKIDKDFWLAIPIDWNTSKNIKWVEWVTGCRANYNKLVEIAMACCREWIFRFSDDEFERVENIDNIHKAYLHLYNPHKLQPVIEWAALNIPSSPDERMCRACEGTGWSGVSYDPNECSNCYGSGKIKLESTHMPLVMSNRYMKVSEVVNYLYDTIESYQNYYRALLQKRKVKCKNCEDGTGYYVFGDETRKCYECDKGYIQKPIVFTRRSVPDFLADLVR